MLDAVHGTDFAREAYLACHADARLNFRIHVAGKDGTDDSQVDGRVVHLEAARNVEENVFLRQLEAYTLFEHGQQHVHAADVEARGRALRIAVNGGADQCLGLNEEGAYAFDGRGDGHTTHAFVILTQQQFGGVAHLAQTVLAHFVDAQLGSTAEAVLDAAQDAVHVVLVALELKDGIDNVLQHFGTRDAAFLVDVTDQDDCRMRLLGEAQDAGGALAHLGDAARRGFQRFGRNSLYGVDDDQVGACVLDVDVDLFERRLAHDEAVRRLFRQPFGTQLQLSRAFFARDVEDAFFRHPQDGLQHQCRFADARLSAYQHQRALHQSASQYAVQFGVVQVDAGFVGRFNFVQSDGLGLGGLDARSGALVGGFLAHDFFDEGIPLSARGTFALPFG